MRAIIFAIAEGQVKLSDLESIDRSEFIDEIRTLAEYLANPDQHFYPAPHPYTITPQPDDYIDMAADSLLFA
ncbi:hypothetical protein MBAV_005049, partial [Candidatus Magnetobacterium bavaricum]